MPQFERSLTLMQLVFLLLPASWLALVSAGPIQWSDSGYFIHEASHGPIFSMNLGALSHPTYHLLIRVVHESFGPHGVAWINPVLALPLTWVLYKLGRGIGLNRDWACIATVSSLLAHGTFWVNSRVEVYSLHLVLVLGAHWICIDKSLHWSLLQRLLALGLLTGLAVTTHQLTLVVMLPLYAWLIARAGVRIGWILPGLALGLGTAYPALFHELLSGKSLFEIVRHYLTGHAATASADWEGAFGRFDLMWRDKSYVAIWALSLVGIQIIGAWPMRRNAATCVLWAAAMLNALFAMSYAVNDRYTFFLPGTSMLAILACLRFQTWSHARQNAWICAGRITAFTTPTLLIATWAGIQLGVITPPAHTVVTPYRDDVRYFLVPYLTDQSASAFARQQREHTPDHALILADYTPLGALTSAQVAGALPLRDVALCDSVLGQRLPHRPVFLVRETYCDHMRAQYVLSSTQSGWRVHQP